MPTLKLAVFCEKVIIDANGAVSLIALFSQINVAVPPGVAFPENAVAPKEWALFCMWECTPEEVGREFSQIFEVYTPSGNLFNPPQTIRFTPQLNRLHQNVIGNAQGLPIGRAGRVTVTTRVERDGEVVVPPMTYGFNIAFVEAT